MALASDLRVSVWMVYLNREYTKEEYDNYHALVKECVSHVTIPYQPTNPDSFRHLIVSLLPLLMMRYRRIRRAKWRDCVAHNGKRWIEQDNLSPQTFLHSMIGYHLAYDHSLCGMAMAQGPQKKVINIGLAILIHKKPSKITLSAYMDSLQHKLTPLELASITVAPDPDAVFRRLCILLTLKSSYTKAIGQNTAFDWVRLEFDMEKKSATVDGDPLTGWEFRIYRAKLGVARGNKLVKEDYQCCCAFFRGCDELRFIWHDSRDLETWVKFISMDKITEVIPSLNA